MHRVLVHKTIRYLFDKWQLTSGELRLCGSYVSVKPGGWNTITYQCCDLLNSLYFRYWRMCKIVCKINVLQNLLTKLFIFVSNDFIILRRFSFKFTISHRVVRLKCNVSNRCKTCDYIMIVVFFSFTKVIE